MRIDLSPDFPATPAPVLFSAPMAEGIKPDPFPAELRMDAYAPRELDDPERLNGSYQRVRVVSLLKGVDRPVLAAWNKQTRLGPDLCGALIARQVARSRLHVPIAKADFISAYDCTEGDWRTLVLGYLVEVPAQYRTHTAQLCQLFSGNKAGLYSRIVRRTDVRVMTHKAHCLKYFR